MAQEWASRCKNDSKAQTPMSEVVEQNVQGNMSGGDGLGGSSDVAPGRVRSNTFNPS